MDKKFATVSWTVEDILTLRPDWSEDQAEEWIIKNQKHIQSRLVELGWEVIETLMECDNV
jgi:hypothetical protein